MLNVRKSLEVFARCSPRGAPETKIEIECALGTRAEMSPELIGVLGVGVSLAALILTAASWIGGWLRDVDWRLTRLEGLIEGAGLFRPTDTSTLPAGD